MPPLRIALAGATGTLGPPILTALLTAGHTLTILTRQNSPSTTALPPHPNLTIRPVDYTSVASLTPALAGISVVISSVAASAIGAQNPLIDAAVAAGVTRFIPAEFGLDSANKNAIPLPIIAPKYATQTYLRAKVRETEGRFSWTAVANGWFLDWVLQRTDILLDVGARRAVLYNGGDVRFSATLLADIARAVVGVVAHQEETANRIVYIHSAVVTQRQLLSYAEAKDGRAWATSEQGTGELLAGIAAAVEKKDWDTAYRLAPTLGCSDADYGCDYTGHEDNALLGVEELGEAELRKLVEDLL